MFIFSVCLLIIKFEITIVWIYLKYSKMARTYDILTFSYSQLIKNLFPLNFYIRNIFCISLKDEIKTMWISTSWNIQSQNPWICFWSLLIKTEWSNWISSQTNNQTSSLRLSGLFFIKMKIKHHFNIKKNHSFKIYCKMIIKIIVLY